ncbi:efflux transporter outer membrane subunit [Glycocaulis abyssi]|uniref:Efflux transporter outer membrane subunit n=1 Tax=Glycocaulis abyssi TaxID=1433403 RepID=A0ABV9NAU3_9PROT
MLRYSLILSSSLIVVACAGTPQLSVAPDLALPDTYVSAPDAAGPQETDWVGALGDEALAGLIATALANNPDLAAARANTEAARASARAGQAPRLPSVDIGTTATTRPAGEVYTAGLDVSWQADVWGRISNQARASALSAEAAEADYAGAELSIAASVARGWFALTEARLQRELSERDVDTRQRQLDIVERRFVRGVVRSSDVRTARSALASSRATLALRQRAEREAARSLQTLLGAYPDGDVAPGTALPMLAPLASPGTPGALISRRPDIVAAEFRLAAAGFSAEAARKALYPSLSLTASYSGQTSEFSDLFSASTLVESLTASLTAPIFRAGALRAERDRTAALARAQAASYVNTSLTALREVENALTADGLLADRVSALETAREEAQAALQLVERQYASGVGTIFELIDAQTRLIQAEAQLITARRERIDNRIALHLAIAGPFSAPAGLIPSEQ